MVTARRIEPMDDTELVAHIQQLQKGLASMKDFHRRYLDRRAMQGMQTATDAIMEGHQILIDKTLYTLEAYKATIMTETE